MTRLKYDLLFSGMHWEIIVYFTEEYDYIPCIAGGNWFSWILWFSFGINIMLCYKSSQYIQKLNYDVNWFNLT